jgi:hypothetical protein
MDEAPWTDPEWAKYKWTVYRGVAYDLTEFAGRHPGGRWLINLAVGRDATGACGGGALYGAFVCVRARCASTSDGAGGDNSDGARANQQLFLTWDTSHPHTPPLTHTKHTIQRKSYTNSAV